MHAIWRGSRKRPTHIFFRYYPPSPPLLYPHFTQTATLRSVGSNKKWPEKNNIFINTFARESSSLAFFCQAISFLCSERFPFISTFISYWLPRAMGLLKYHGLINFFKVQNSLGTIKNSFLSHTFLYTYHGFSSEWKSFMSWIRIYEFFNNFFHLSSNNRKLSIIV